MGSALLHTWGSLASGMPAPEEGCPWPGGVLILAFHPRDHEVSLPVPAVPGVQDAVAAPAQTHLPLPAEPSYSSRSSGAAPWV